MDLSAGRCQGQDVTNANQATKRLTKPQDFNLEAFFISTKL